MGQRWTDEMQADLERWQASLEGAKATLTMETGSQTLHVSDVLRGLAAYCVSVVRHRVLRGAPPLWSLAQSIDYAAFTRRLGEADPYTKEWFERDLGILDGMKM
jgi:hypothetical protein